MVGEGSVELSGRRARLAGNPVSAVYGSIVVAGMLVAESSTTTTIPYAVAEVLVTLTVFWIAHAYSHLVGHGVPADGSWFGSLRTQLRREWPIVESAFAPLVALIVARIVTISRSNAYLVATIVTVVELAGWAGLASRRHDISPAQRAMHIAAACGLGAIIIALKALKSLTG